METVYSMDEHVISCELKDIPSQIKGVRWNPAKPKANSYTIVDGTHGATSQTSTLTISSHQLGLLSLKNSGQTHTFTCEITVGVSDTPIRATQTIAVYTPSGFCLLELKFDYYSDGIISCLLQSTNETKIWRFRNILAF
jgi:hypothetical protein